jgi:malate synthase
LRIDKHKEQPVKVVYFKSWYLLCYLLEKRMTIDFQFSSTMPEGVTILGAMNPEFAALLDSETMAFVAKLHRQFEPRRQALLAQRVERTQRLDAGEKPNFLPETQAIREGDWRIAPLPQSITMPPR